MDQGRKAGCKGWLWNLRMLSEAAGSPLARVGHPRVPCLPGAARLPGAAHPRVPALRPVQVQWRVSGPSSRGARLVGSSSLDVCRYILTATPGPLLSNLSPAPELYFQLRPLFQDPDTHSGHLSGCLCPAVPEAAETQCAQTAVFISSPRSVLQPLCLGGRHLHPPRSPGSLLELCPPHALREPVTRPCCSHGLEASRSRILPCTPPAPTQTEPPSSVIQVTTTASYLICPLLSGPLHGSMLLIVTRMVLKNKRDCAASQPKAQDLGRGLCAPHVLAPCCLLLPLVPLSSLPTTLWPHWIPLECAELLLTTGPL